MRDSSTVNTANSTYFGVERLGSTAPSIISSRAASPAQMFAERYQGIAGRADRHCPEAPAATAFSKQARGGLTSPAPIWPIPGSRWAMPGG